MNDELDPIYGPIQEQKEKIKKVENLKWLAHELDFAYKVPLPTISI